MRKSLVSGAPQAADMPAPSTKTVCFRLTRDRTTCYLRQMSRMRNRARRLDAGTGENTARVVADWETLPIDESDKGSPGL